MLAASALFIFFSATGGFIFVSRCYKWKYELARESGYKLYLSCLSFGFVFLIAAWMIVQTTYWVPEVVGFSPWFRLSEISRILVICTSTMAFGWIAAETCNRFNENSKELALDRAWQKNDFDQICAKAIGDAKPIAVSLDSRKVYVGYVVDTLSPDEDNSHLTILPIYSGYRDEKTLKFTLVTEYRPVVEALEMMEKDLDPGMDIEDYNMAIPREKINTLHVFNDHLHASVSSDYPGSQSAI